MPQTSLAWLAAGLLGGLVLSWPADLAAPHAQRLAGARRIAAPAPPGSDDADVSIADDLGGCTPFLAIDGDRELDFDTARGEVVETLAPSPARGDGRAPSTRRIGTFSTVERTGQVVVVLAGVRRHYTLVIPADGTHCILAFGAAQAVNLERSWFGQVSDGPDVDPPSYQHAAAPRSQGGRAARSVRLGQLARPSAL